MSILRESASSLMWDLFSFSGILFLFHVLSTLFFGYRSSRSGIDDICFS